MTGMKRLGAAGSATQARGKRARKADEQDPTGEESAPDHVDHGGEEAGPAEGAGMSKQSLDVLLKKKYK